MNHALGLRGVFTYRRYSRQGRFGHRRLISQGRLRNGICNAAVNDILNVYFRAVAQRTAWYCGLIDLAGFTALAQADTMASHAGWTEITAYSSATRPVWSPSAAAAGIIVNPSLIGFTMTANATAHGLFIASDNTKGGTAGLLWATGAFSSDQQMANGELLSVDYQLTAAAGAGS